MRVWLGVLLTLVAVESSAADGRIRGSVVDLLGAPVPRARVEVRAEDGAERSAATTDAGSFAIDAVPPGRYRVAVTAEGFEPLESDAIYVADGGEAALRLTLQIGVLKQETSVTASASEVSLAQVGASVTVLDSAAFDRSAGTELLEPLRGVSGVAIVQLGQRGSATTMFVRGGSGSFNKVLIDGMPVNEIGGGFDLANLAVSGIERAEMLRGANSVVYGTDAMSGVLDVATRQGRTRQPEGTVQIAAGNLGTVHSDLSLGGVAGPLDYFASYSGLSTDNQVPNSQFDNRTVASRVGVALGGRTRLTGTFRWNDAEVGSPNAFAYFGIADDASALRDSRLGTLVARTQLTDRLQTTVRFGVTDQGYTFSNPTPTGTPSDDSAFANFLGRETTIIGGNGYSTTGRAILDYSGIYPSLYRTTTNRRQLYAQASYQASSSLNVSAGLRVEREHGTAKGDFDPRPNEVTRNNYGGFVEGRGALGTRAFVTAGLGFDHNAVFGNAMTPRVSFAFYVRTPSSAPGAFGDTKLTLNAGRGIKAPTLDQQLSSVYGLLSPETIAATGVGPIGAERSRTWDVGVEQGLASGRARVRASYFDSRFSDLIEYLSKGVLPQLGVPQEAVNALSFGAYANAQSNIARGLELSADAVAGDLKVTAAYTYLDAEVTASLNSGVLFPMENPAFPGIQIGQYAPLVGARPFRRPANSGSVSATYSHRALAVAISGFFFGRSDDSTYLSDAFFGGSMLLPNANLNPAYQRFDLTAAYRLHPRIRLHGAVENLFDESYQAAAGFPSLPRVARLGVSVLLGGGR